MKKNIIILVLLFIQIHAQEFDNAQMIVQHYHPLINLLYNLDTSFIDPLKPDAYFEIFLRMF